MLPNIPNDVFDFFILPCIDDIGWPFQSINDSLSGTDWFRILYPFSLSSFSKLTWKRSSLFLNKNILHPISCDDINLIILNKSTNILAFIPWDSKSSRNRLAWLKKHTQATGRFPTPITVAFTPWGLKILDGNHRVAAIFDLGIQNLTSIDAWIGK